MSRIRPSLLLAVLCVLSVPARAAPPALELAWKRGGSVEHFLLPQDVSLAGPRGGEALASDPRTPLGSLWKLFIYAYLADKALAVPAYVCDGSNRKEEAFCCDPGSSIGSEEAMWTAPGLSSFAAEHLLNIFVLNIH